MSQLLQIFDPISSGSTQEQFEYQICRFCLENSSKYINLLEKCGEEISTFMQTYHNVTIDPCDAWPKSACLSCVSRITSFRTLCDTIRNSEEALRQIFGDSSSNVCIKKEEEEEVFSESFTENFPEALPECFPEAPPESFPESVMEVKIKDEVPVEEKLEEFEEFFSMTCDLCKKGFRKFDELRLHFRDEHLRHWYIRCCERKLRYKKDVLIHLQYHRNPDIFKCFECSKQFMNEEGIVKHIENCHKIDNKIFECHLCQKAYATKSSLRIHIRLKHLKFPKWKPISKKITSSTRSVIECICEICGKSFTSNKSLKKHVRNHRPNCEPLSTFKCEKCGNAYKTLAALRNHARKHDSYGTYKCKHCGKISPTPGALNKHIRDAHQLTRAFICHICNKGFKWNTALKEHVATHTGEYLYSCDYCPKQFRAAASKSQHIGREHPEKRIKR